MRVDPGTIVTMDPARRVLEGSVLIEDGRIAAVGPEACGAEADRVIEAPGMAALPGLIDAHAHAGHSLVKSMGSPDPEAWYRVVDTAFTRASDAEFWGASAALSALERIRCGTTTCVSLLGGGNAAMRSDAEAPAAAHAEAIMEAGLGEVLAIGPTIGPRAYLDRSGSAPRETAPSFEDQLAVSLAVAERWHGGRISVALLYPTIRPEHVARLSPEAIELACREARHVRRAARRRGLLFTQDGHERGTVARAHRLGLLGPRTLLSHAVDLEPGEIAMLSDTGSSVAHNPFAHASITGYCDVPAMRRAGIAVGLGSDATAPDRPHDLFRHMAHGLHHHRREARGVSAMAPGAMLEAATCEGARALGMEGEIGSLEPGKRADMILVDLVAPHLIPRAMPLHRLTQFASGADVDTVIVEGRVLMEGRHVLTLDAAAVAARAEVAAETMVARSGFAADLSEGDAFWGRAP